MAAEIIYGDHVPREVQGAAGPILRRYLPYLPTRVRRVWVEFENDGENGSRPAASVASPEYGFLKVWLYANWLREDAASRERIVAHELAHGILEPLVGFTSDLVESFAPETARDFILDQWRQRFEQVVEELSDAMTLQQKRTKT